jgi:signal transduction histidine kinase
MQLAVGSEAGIIQTVIPYAFARPTPEDLKIGASVRVTGVYVYGSMQDQGSGAWTGIETPSILAASDEDLIIVSSSPFWTPVKFWVLIGGILLFAGALVFWVKSREAAKADAVQRERLRLSRDLHDGFQQLLAGSMFRLEAAMNLMPEGATKAREQLEKACDALYHAQTGLRAALWSMTEESEGPNNLSGLVKYAAGRLAHWQGVVHFEFRGEERHVPPSFSGEILMGLQEAVGNALRHGGATDVKVVFSFRREELVISVRDNGCGFDPASVEGSGHLGLRSMRERAERHGGTLKTTSEIGAGTIIVVRLPYDPQGGRRM